MLSFILSILVGWPAILATLVLTLLGLIRSNFRLLFFAAIIAFPISWFLSGLPEFHFPALLNLFLPALLYGSSLAMYRDRQMIAWLLAIPFFLFVILLFFAVSA